MVRDHDASVLGRYTCLKQLKTQGGKARGISRQDPRSECKDAARNSFCGACHHVTMSIPMSIPGPEQLSGLVNLVRGDLSKLGRRCSNVGLPDINPGWVCSGPVTSF